MTRWEYKVATISNLYAHELSARMNLAAHAGDSDGDGWEIFAVESGPAGLQLYMKRPLREPLTSAELAERAAGTYFQAPASA